jgi:divalent metal cation (Fe/Co/Zn/Cd) transporter
MELASLPSTSGTRPPTSTNQNFEFTQLNSFFKQLEEESARRKIVYVEYVSIVVTLVCTVISAYLAFENLSTSALAVAADSLLDMLAYTTVIWRYFSVSDLNSRKREKIALLIFSIMFFLSSFGIEYVAVSTLISKQKPVASHLFIFISVAQSILFSIMSLIKFSLSEKILLNQAIVSSAINSLIAAIENLSMAVSMSVYVLNPRIWYLDSFFGLSIGVLVFFYGLSLFISIFKQ